MSKQRHEIRAMSGFLAGLICVATCGQLTADPQESKTPETTAAKLRGIWKMTSIEDDGRKIKPPLEMLFTFKQDTVEQKVAGRSQTNKYNLDSENPNYLDIVRENDGQRRIFKMIFSIDNDILKMCSGKPGAERPSKFTSEDGYSIQLLERVDTQDE